MKLNLLFVVVLALGILVADLQAQNPSGQHKEEIPDLEHDPMHLKHGGDHVAHREDSSPDLDPSEDYYETPDSKIYKHIRQQLEHLHGDSLVNTLKKMVSEIDTNRDQRLDGKELLAWAIREGEKGAATSMFDATLWRDFDQNNDSFVSFKEIVTSLSPDSNETNFEALKFKLADANNDSLLSREEIVQFLEPHYFRQMTDYVAKETMQAYDGNGDGKVSKDEFLTYVGVSPHEGGHDELEHFRHLDRDGNLILDETEFRSLMTDYGIESIASSQVKRMLEVADRDRNGILSISEIFSHPTIFIKCGREDYSDRPDQGDHPDLPQDEVETGEEDDEENQEEDNHTSRGGRDEL